MVRNQRLYLQALQGWVPVHILLHALDDAYLDPLELRADSTPGRNGPGRRCAPVMCWWFRCRGGLAIGGLCRTCLTALAGLAGRATGTAGSRRAAGRDAALGWPWPMVHMAGNLYPAHWQRQRNQRPWRRALWQRAAPGKPVLAGTLHRARHAYGAAGPCGATGSGAQQPHLHRCKWIVQMQAHLGGPAAASFEFNLRAMHLAATALRERFTHAHWERLLRTVEDCRHNEARPHPGRLGGIEQAPAPGHGP